MFHNTFSAEAPALELHNEVGELPVNLNSAPRFITTFHCQEFFFASRSVECAMEKLLSS